MKSAFAEKEGGGIAAIYANPTINASGRAGETATAQRCLITMQLALIITLARRAFSDVYPVIKLDLLFLVARYLLFSAVAPDFVLSASLFLTSSRFCAPFASLIRFLSRCNDASIVGVVIIFTHHSALYITFARCPSRIAYTYLSKRASDTTLSMAR